MIKDFALADADIELSTDVAVVGAGIAGLFLANRLAEEGIRVVVVESGGPEQKDDVHPLNSVVHLGQPYTGASHGRFRCLGGTSTRWGGALLPFVDEDMASRPYLGLEAWPIGMGDLAPFLPELERIFDVDPGSYEQEILDRFGRGNALRDGSEGDFLPRFAKWPVFKRRNVATLFRDRIGKDAGVEVWLHAHALAIHLDEGRKRIAEIVCHNPADRKLRVRARHYVICAGAIESTRLMLQFDEDNGGIFSSSCTALGRYFHDHVSAPTARIVADRPRALNRLAGHRFIGETMRSLRFELSPSARREDRVAGAFAHIAFESRETTGFDHLRALFRGVQQRQGISAGLLAALLKSTPYLATVGYWRYAHKQLYWPKADAYRLHTVVEQLPRSRNRITLSDAADVFGKRLAAIDWRLDESILETLRAFRRRFESYWSRHGLDRIARLEWSGAIDSLDAFASHAGDICHPGGTTRMGSKPSEAVVDADLRSFALPNLWISSTSTFPAGGSANPTLMLILFTLRLGKRLVGELRA